MTLQRFSSQHPCPICGGWDKKPRGQSLRCFGFLSGDGRYAHCTREDQANGIQVNPESSSYAHRLDADCACGTRHLPPAAARAAPRGNKGKVAATYDYTDRNGKLLYQVVRYEPKGFSCRRPGDSGGWIGNMKGVERVPYRFPDVLEAVKRSNRVYIAEGEKDVDAIVAAGGVATCNPGGAGKWTPQYSEYLRGADVVIVSDKDEDGTRHAGKVAASLRGVAASVSVVEAKEGKDAADHLSAGFGLEEFLPVGHDQEAVESGTGACGKRPIQSQADKIINLVIEAGTELFADSTGVGWARIPVRNTLRLLQCRGKEFKRWVAGLYWNRSQKAANADSLTSALNVLEAKALFEGSVHFLHTRVADHEGSFWYDLTDHERRAVRVTPSGWSIIATPPILFRRYPHQQPQVTPEGGGDLHQLLEFLNIGDKGQQLLLLVYLVTCLVPNIPHPIPVLHGGHGCAKTTSCKLMRRIIDPSLTETMTLAHDRKEFVQQLAHNWMPFFDNITSLSDWVSDALCRAATGDGFSKRALYTDEDDVIFSFMRCTGLNGINIAAQKPDLLDRSMLIRLDPIASKSRKSEKSLFDEFERVRPRLVGAAFDALSRAMKLRPSIRVEHLPRMADFALWGCAVAEALGHPQGNFLAAFDANFRARNEEALASDPVGTAVRAFMKSRPQWQGKGARLLAELMTIAASEGLDTKEKRWPKKAHTLTRRLNETAQNLRAVGIQVTTGGTDRMVTILKVPGNSVDSVDSGEMPADPDDPRSPLPSATNPYGPEALPERTPGNSPPDVPKPATYASDAVSRTVGGADTPTEEQTPLEVFEL